jgi:uncharacterized membrane protein YgdD (TMEM256/DUF423 family)
MHKGFLKTGFLLGALSVALGAFGAHALKELLAPLQLSVFETAVRYQFYHVFALLSAGVLYKEFPGKLVFYAGCFFIAGILLFCGSLYALCYVNNAALPGYGWLGPLAPFGGLFFILGWIMMFTAVFKKP